MSACSLKHKGRYVSIPEGGGEPASERHSGDQKSLTPQHRLSTEVVESASSQSEFSSVGSMQSLSTSKATSSRLIELSFSIIRALFAFPPGKDNLDELKVAVAASFLKRLSRLLAKQPIHVQSSYR